MIEIDGSHGEGGGQIVRTACSLAAFTAKACHIFNIRQARARPGLQRQHLLGVRALAELSEASLQGDQLGSADLVFRPRKIVPHDLDIKIDTAASTPLILQSLIPATLAAPRPLTVRLHGGATDTAMSPTLDYFRHVFLWFLQRMGLTVEIEFARRGYYPKGGAELAVKITPAHPEPISATQRGALKAVRLISQASNVLKARKVAERQVAGALRVLESLSLPLEMIVDYGPSFSPGCSLCIVAEFEGSVIGADAIGAPRKRAEQVGQEAALAFVKEANSPACLDRHMADQILPYLALAGSGGCVTVSEVTRHCVTNIWVLEKFLERSFEVSGNLIRVVASERGRRSAPA